MPTATAEDWATIAARLRAVPAGAATATRASLPAAAGRSDVSPRRQVEGVIAPVRERTARSTASSPTFAESAAAAARSAGLAGRRGRGVRADGRRGVRRARGFLQRADPAAWRPEADGCGREKYALWSRAFVGADRRLRRGLRLGPGRAGPDHRRDGAAGRPDPVRAQRFARRWTSSTPTRPTSCTAPTSCRPGCSSGPTRRSASSTDTHFDIPEPLRTIECCIAPTHEGGIYYTAPSDDFSRPGPDVVVGARRTSTSSRPGASSRPSTTRACPAITSRSARPSTTARELNRWRRLDCWVSGHGEGWALYAERLMDDLGFLDDPGDRLGMLDGQSLRAARVVLDIGVHLRAARAGRGRRRRLGLRQGLGVPVRALGDGRRLPALRAGPLPRLAGPGAVVQARRAALAAAARRGQGGGQAPDRSTSRSSTARRSTSARCRWTCCAHALARLSRDDRRPARRWSSRRPRRPG